jgi:hypothetical protein
MGTANDTFVIVFLGILGFVLNLWIMYGIIRSANDTTNRDRIQIQNQKLLALLAAKMGCDIEEIKKVIGDNYKIT